MIAAPEREGQVMRTSAIGLVIALVLIPVAAFAQAGPPGGPGGPPPPQDQGAPPPPGAQGGPPPPGAQGAPPPPGAISREQFVQQRAAAAGRLFDQIDTNHLGYITRAQLRAWMAERRGGPPGRPPQQ
jgi:hypothetical protein